MTKSVRKCTCGQPRYQCMDCAIYGCSDPDCLRAFPWYPVHDGPAVRCLDCHYRITGRAPHVGSR
jgi:hypothetical protein